MGIYVENNLKNAEFYIEKLFQYFNVSSAVELSEKLNISQKNISNWKIRNSVNAIKKICRELGIYSVIFEESINSINNFQYSQNGIGQNFAEVGYISNSSDKEQKAFDKKIENIFNLIYFSAEQENRLEELKLDLLALLKKYV